MGRADALRALIERVEARESEGLRRICDAAGLDFFEVGAALNGGSLDAVARLEAPLRRRGWCLSIHDDGTGDNRWIVHSFPPPRRRRTQTSRAPTEARARLLAYLRALLWEAEHEDQRQAARDAAERTREAFREEMDALARDVDADPLLKAMRGSCRAD